MRDQALFDKIDLHLIRVLHTVLTERSVSRAAIRLGMHQPAVSAALKRLRELSGDPLLVRSGSSMVPTDAALRMVEPAADILRSAGPVGGGEAEEFMRVVVSGILYFNSQIGSQRLFYMRIQLSFW